MKIEFINNTSKKDQKIARSAALHAYSNRRWTYNSIWSAYGKPSEAKCRAWNYCRELCDKLGGHDLIISSKNTMVFSVCFKFETEDGKPAFAYITRDYDRFCYADSI